MGEEERILPKKRVYGVFIVENLPLQAYLMRKFMVLWRLSSKKSTQKKSDKTGKFTHSIRRLTLYG
jgi:hypothetical protein